MKKFIYILAVSMLGMMGCSEDTITYINPTPGEEPSEVIAELGISSKNTWFTPADGLNAAIGFKSLGGEVVVDIQTNVAWKYTATGAEWLTIEKDDVADQLILSCESNKVEEKQNSTVTVTAGDKTVTIAVSQNAYGTLEISASENNFQIPARGELTASFEVLSTDEDWVYETKACPWLLVERDGKNVTVTLDPNEEIEDRETTFELIAGKGGGNPVSETIRVTQDRAAFISTSLKTVPFAATPTKAKELSVESNFEWEYTLTEGSDWLTVKRTEEGLEVSSIINPDASSRSATITITAGDGKANMAEQTITVSQTGFDFDAFHHRAQRKCRRPAGTPALRQGDQRHDRLGRRHHRGECHHGVPAAHLHRSGLLCRFGQRHRALAQQHQSQSGLQLCPDQPDHRNIQLGTHRAHVDGRGPETVHVPD
jgi:hypothetical protein